MAEIQGYFQIARTFKSPQNSTREMKYIDCSSLSSSNSPLRDCLFLRMPLSKASEREESNLEIKELESLSGA